MTDGPERPELYVFHIGKTGGTALNDALVTHAASCAYTFQFRGHAMKLTDVPAGKKFLFVVRDPLHRFVSAFNGRLREDRPRYHYPWTSEERTAFAAFETPDALARALSSDHARTRERAERAMRGIGHLNSSYWYWFHDESTFRARESDMLFIGFTERLTADFEILKSKLGLPSEAQLPSDERAAHRTPASFDAHLSDVARTNLERWYADDLAFLRICEELAPRVNTRA